MSSLVDQYGAPISSRKFLSAANNGDGNRPSIPVRALDPLRKLLTYQDWKTISFLSSKLFGNFGIVKGAICQKAMYAVGNSWQPVFEGEASEWGEVAKKWLVEQWYPTCDTRGPNFDFVTGLYLDSITADRDGDAVAILTRSEITKWPQIQRIPSRQIGQWMSPGSYSRTGREIVSDGDYKGAYIENGVIMNRQGRPIAFRKLEEEDGKFTDIPAASVCHIFDPEWYEQSRGLPLMSASIDEFRDIAQSGEWERMAMLIASSIGILEYNDSGADENDLDPLNAISTDENGNEVVATENGMTVKSMSGGLVRYFKANTGAKIEQFVNNRPGDDWEKFNDRQIRQALAGANWPYSMVWKPDGTNGTVQRSELNKAKMAVKDRQSLLFWHARRMVGYAISVAIKDGILDPYPGSDAGGFLKWNFSMPASITIDEGRDRDQAREDYMIGFSTMEARAAELGTTWQYLRGQKEKEVRDLIARAQAIAKESGVTLDMALVLLQKMGGSMNAPGGVTGMPIGSDQTQQ